MTRAQPVIDRMLVRDQIDLDQLTAAVDASRRRGSATRPVTEGRPTTSGWPTCNWPGGS